MSMRTGTMKKRTVSTIAGPRKIKKFARLRVADRAWPRRSIISSSAIVVIACSRGRIRRGTRAIARYRVDRARIAAYLTTTSSRLDDASSITNSAASSAESRPNSTPWIAA